MRHQYSTGEYQFAHGRTPKGTGQWAFKITAIYGYSVSDLDEIYFESGTLREAKKKFEKRIKKIFPKASWIMAKVMP